MPQEGVFLDVLPRFDMAAGDALISKVTNAWRNAGLTVGKEFSEAASAGIMRFQQQAEDATNRATQAQIRAAKLLGDAQVTEAKRGAEAEAALAKAAEDRSAKEIAAINAVNLARRRSSQADVEAQQATQRATKASATATDAAAASALTFGKVANGIGAGSVAALGGALALTTDKAANFQTQMVKLTASAGESAANIKQVQDGITSMAGAVGYSVGQLGDAAYVVEKAGFRGRDALTLLTAGAQGAKAENADLKEVIGGLSTSLNDFHVPTENAADVMSKLVVAVGSSRATFQEFTGALHSVEPAAAAAGIKMEDLFAVIAQGTQSGASADQVTDNIRNALNALSGAQGPARDAMAQFGINADEVSQKLGQRGLAGTFQYLADTIKSKVDANGLIPTGEFKENAQSLDTLTQMMTAMSPAAQQVAEAFHNGAISRKEFTIATRNADAADSAQLQQFGTLQLKLDGFSSRYKTGRSELETYNQALRDMTGTVAGQTIALQVTGDNTDRTNNLIAQLKGTTRETDGTVKGFNETIDTLNGRWDQAKASMGAAATELGATVLPAMTTAVEEAAHVAQFLAEHKRLAEILMGTLGLLGTAWLTVKTAMAIGSTVTALRTGFTAIGGFVTGLAGRYDALATSANLAADAEARAANPSTFEKGAGVGTAVRGATGVAAAAAPLVGTAWGFLDWGQGQFDAAGNPASGENARARGAAGIANRPAPGVGNLPNLPFTQGPGSQAERRGNTTPPPAADTAPPLPATDAAQPAPDAGGGSGDLLGGLGSNKDTATAPNIDVNLPYHPLDLNLADKPANETINEWISGQKGVQTAMDALDTSAVEQSKAQAHMAELLKKGHATQEEWNTAAAEVAKANHDQAQAQQDLTIAQIKQTADANKTGKDREGGGLTGTSILKGGFDFSPKSIGQFFTTLLVDLALGNPLGKQMAAERGSESNPLFVTPVGGSLTVGGQGQPGAIDATDSGNFSVAGGGVPGNVPANGLNLATIPVAAQKYANDCIDASARIILSHSGVNMSEDQLENVITPGGSIDSQAAGLNKLDPQGGFKAMQGSGGSQQAMFAAIKASIDNGTGSILNVAPGSSLGGHNFAPGHFIAATGYNPDGSINVSDSAGGGRTYSVSEQDAFQATEGRGIVAGTGVGPAPTGAGSQPAVTDSANISPSGWGANWDAIAQKESGGNWGDNTGNGFSGGLQFLPSTWASNKPPGAPDQAWQASKDQQIAAAESVLKTQGPGAWPNTFVPATGGGGGGRFASGLPFKRGPGIDPNSFGTDPNFTPAIPGAPGGPLGPQAPGDSPLGLFSNGLGGGPGAQAARRGAAAPGAAPSMGGAPAAPAAPAIGNTGGQFSGGSGPGFKSNIGSAVAGAIGGGIPGSEQAGQLVDRAIGYAGQVGGILAMAPLETFGLNDSKTGDLSKSWFGKLAGGLAGAHKSSPNTAGATAAPVAPPAPPLKPGDPATGNGSGPPPGPPAPLVQINEQHNHNSDGSDAGPSTARAFMQFGQR